MIKPGVACMKDVHWVIFLPAEQKIGILWSQQEVGSTGKCSDTNLLTVWRDFSPGGDLDE